MRSRECYKAMNERNCRSIHGTKRSRRGTKYLEKGEPGGGIGDTNSWREESTQELENPMEEPRNHHQGVLEPLHGLFLSLGKNGEEGV
jgi:hypothetical protein